MDQQIGERVGLLERDLSQVKVEQARQGTELTLMRGQLSDVGDGVKQLLQREARRPPSLTLQTVAITCSGMGAIAAVVWWLIGTSPAVQELTRRVDRLDDPQVGRVGALERDVERLKQPSAWTPTAIVRGR